MEPDVRDTMTAEQPFNQRLPWREVPYGNNFTSVLDADDAHIFTLDKPLARFIVAAANAQRACIDYVLEVLDGVLDDEAKYLKAAPIAILYAVKHELQQERTALDG